MHDDASTCKCFGLEIWKRVPVSNRIVDPQNKIQQRQKSQRLVNMKRVVACDQFRHLSRVQGPSLSSVAGIKNVKHGPTFSNSLIRGILFITTAGGSGSYMER